MTTNMIALDWGTSRLRAYLIAPSGDVLGRRSLDAGVSTVAAGEFPDVFDRVAGDWRGAYPDAAILMAGMVGSRNGWREAAYVGCPAGPGDLVEALLRVDLGTGKPLLIVPGVSVDSGHLDVMRGEETLALGAGMRDGLVCLPGTHSKWVEMREGRIQRFATFMTGEIYGLLRHQSLLSRLAEAPAADDESVGIARGLAAATLPAGLLNAAFLARSEVLAGRLPPGAVGPYLSALLIGFEIAGAQALFGLRGTVTLVADQGVRAAYETALAGRDLTIRCVTPEAAFVVGVQKLADALKEREMEP